MAGTGEVKQDILNKALDLFALKGFDAVGVAEICSACSITKPSLYHHFGSKDGLLSAVIEDAMDKFNSYMGDSLEYKNDYAADIPALFHRFLRFSIRRPIHFQYLVDSIFSPPQSTLSAHSENLKNHVLSQLRGFFVSVGEHHGNVAGKDHMLALSFIGTSAAVSRHLAGDSMPGNNELTEQLIKNFIHGIFA